MSIKLRDILFLVSAGGSYVYLMLELITLEYMFIPFFEELHRFFIITFNAIVASTLILTVNKFFFKVSWPITGFVLAFFGGVYFIIVRPWPNYSILFDAITFIVMASVIWCPVMINLLIKPNET